MKERAKLNQEVKIVTNNIIDLAKKFGTDFLPILVICSPTNSDIIRIDDLPDEPEIITHLLDDIGGLIAKKIKDASNFVLIQGRTDKVKSLKMIVKSYNGLSRIIMIKINRRGESLVNDMGWYDRKSNQEFFVEPSLDNLDDLLRSYRFNLIVQK